MSDTPLRERARGRWQGILPALGIDAKYLTGKHTGCPVCRQGKDRFRFDDRDGAGTWICAQCGAGDGVSLVMQALGIEFKEAAMRIEEHIGAAPVRAVSKNEMSDDERRARNNKLWQESRPIVAADPAARHLMNRGLTLASYPACLRYNPSVRYQDVVAGVFGPKSFHPAMIAKLVAPDGRPLTLHRTYLTEAGQKASVECPRKLVNGRGLQGGAVRLAAPTKVLGIAEGIETALAASELYGVPCWASLNAALMMSWEPPAHLEEIYIFADNDEHHKGAFAAASLAQRLAKSFPKVTIATPERRGEDWNDVLLRERPRAA